MDSSADSGAVIEVAGLGKVYGSLVAVDDLSFSVRRGDVYGFLGQNGAGKSTTIRMLLTLIRPTSGSIRMFGMDISRHRSEILARVGAVIEKPDLYGYLTGRENLRILARLSGCRDRKAIDRVLDTVGLAARADDRVRTYSQGMRQRLGIACALVHDPELVILDEPTNGLDPQGIADIRNLILRLSREGGKTFLVSSHLLSEMELIANRMVIIDKGRKVVEGECRTLLDPERQVVHLETMDDVQTRVRLARSRWAAHIEDDPQGRIRLSLDRADVPQLVRELSDMDVQILALRPFNRLEDYFLSLTQAG
ncbi:MAG: ABC transporter ATP-binding protein [Chitinophagia bacterium]|nr:ABC transporter ATP-binding protein [Chitinophagia bacterium]